VQNYIELLKALQAKIPQTCNLANISLLKELFAEYKFIVYGMPETFATVKSYCENNSYRIRTKIDDTAATSNSWGQKKLLFEEARRAIHEEIGNIILQSAECYD